MSQGRRKKAQEAYGRGGKEGKRDKRKEGKGGKGLASLPFLSCPTTHLLPRPVPAASTQKEKIIKKKSMAASRGKRGKGGGERPSCESFFLPPESQLQQGEKRKNSGDRAGRKEKTISSRSAFISPSTWPEECKKGGEFQKKRVA